MYLVNYLTRYLLIMTHVVYGMDLISVVINGLCQFYKKIFTRYYVYGNMSHLLTSVLLRITTLQLHFMNKTYLIDKTTVEVTGNLMKINNSFIVI